jgi:hypothetical protein
LRLACVVYLKEIEMMEISYTELYLIGVILLVCGLYAREAFLHKDTKIKTMLIFKALAEGKAKFTNVTDGGFEIEPVKGEK